jgi:hypothetical protein
MSDPRVLSLDDIKGLAARLSAAAGSVPRALRTDIVLASLLLKTLLRTGVIAGPVTLGGRDDG